MLRPLSLHAAHLLDAGASPHAATADHGQTALHLAALNGCSAMLAFLTSRGADPEVKDREGRTAAQLQEGEQPGGAASAERGVPPSLDLMPAGEASRGSSASSLSFASRGGTAGVAGSEGGGSALPSPAGIPGSRAPSGGYEFGGLPCPPGSEVGGGESLLGTHSLLPPLSASGSSGSSSVCSFGGNGSPMVPLSSLESSRGKGALCAEGSVGPPRSRLCWTALAVPGGEGDLMRQEAARTEGGEKLVSVAVTTGASGRLVFRITVIGAKEQVGAGALGGYLD